jgi:hypothetical protein
MKNLVLCNRQLPLIFNYDSNASEALGGETLTGERLRNKIKVLKEKLKFV